MKRFWALLLCLVMVFALFSVSASAAYSTTSNRGDDLVYPNARDYYAAPWAAQILAFKENGAIYIMPMPEPGHGNLGTVRTETWVLVLAEKNGFFFFVTGEGHYGWAWNEWFEYEEEKVSPKAWGKSVELDYPLYSSYGAPLVLPKDADRFDEPRTMTVAELSSGRIHLMPMPEKGHGNMGIIESGAEVEVLAEKDGFYFFQTEDGRCGWNGTRWFED